MPNHGTFVWRAYSGNSLKPVVCVICTRQTRFPARYGFHYRLKPRGHGGHHRQIERRCGRCLA